MPLQPRMSVSSPGLKVAAAFSRSGRWATLSWMCESWSWRPGVWGGGGWVVESVLGTVLRSLPETV